MPTADIVIDTTPVARLQSDRDGLAARERPGKVRPGPEDEPLLLGTGRQHYRIRAYLAAHALDNYEPHP